MAEANQSRSSGIELELMQAKQSANYYFEAYRNASLNITHQRRQNQHDQAIIRDLRGQLHQTSLELHWYQAAFPNARADYHLKTNIPAKLLISAPPAQVPNPKEEGRMSLEKAEPPRVATKKTKVTKKTKQIRTHDLRRSLRLQGLGVIEEDIEN
ncbi:hypothetical protein Dda_7411 [Drechslerella dactyloides]|uniref:Uncharacterized protein n=1 Tax=Drechslerella dactyloides TaxID=74499 RepID=A0AAD6IS73_DREDA|nr:hypothetical protein Dda_7411 [Drechslerella dactyloides]